MMIYSDFESKTFRSILEFFERMDLNEAIYEGAG